MRLTEIAAKNVVTLFESDSLDKAIALMEEHGIHHLPVVNGEQSPVGMVSDRDLLKAVGWLSRLERTDPHDGTVIGPRQIFEVMSKPVHTLAADATIENGARLMLREKVSAVPLVSDGCMAGIVTETDLLACYIEDQPLEIGTAWRFQKVSDHMAVHVFSLTPKDAVIAASRLMRDKQIRHIPIVNHGRLVGIVSDRDIRQAAFREFLWNQQDEGPDRRRLHRVNVQDIMNGRVQTVRLSATLADAADRMVQSRIGSLPVVEQDELIGVITETDLLKAFVGAFSS